MKNYNTRSLLLLLLLGFIWGSSYSIARFAMLNSVPALGYAWWQSFGPALLLFIVLKLRRLAFSFSPHYRRYYLITGALGIAIPNANMYFSAPHLPAGIVAVIVNTVPLIVYPIALCIKAERFSIIRMISILIGVTGLMLLVIPEASLPQVHHIGWIISTLISPLGFALCYIYGDKQRPQNADSLVLSAGILMTATILLTPFVIALHDFYWFDWPFKLADYAIILEIILSSLGYFILFELLKNAGAVYASLVSTIVALTGLFWGYLIFNEHLNLISGAAVGLIIIAIILASLPLKLSFIKKTK